MIDEQWLNSQIDTVPWIDQMSDADLRLQIPLPFLLVFTVEDAITAYERRVDQ